MIHETATVDEGAEIGEGTQIWHYVHVRSTARIGRGCRIGKSAYIDADVVIGNNCKIQNMGTIYKGVTIGNNVFVGPHAVFTNDMYPRAEGEFELVSTVVEDGASIGANATVVCGITIGRYAMIGAGSVVTKDVPPHALILGNPGRIAGYMCRCGKRLSRKDGATWECQSCHLTVDVEEDRT